MTTVDNVAFVESGHYKRKTTVFRRSSYSYASTVCIYFSRTLAPTVGGSIFAWSITDGQRIGFPFDVNLIFIIFGAVFLVANIICAVMPERLNRQNKPQE